MTGVNLLAMLERRLDNVVYRLGFADSRAQARQLVRHGHFEVNGRKTDIPSFQVSIGDVISVRQSAVSKIYFKDRAQLMQSGAQASPTGCVESGSRMSAEVLANPAREDVEIPLNEQFIVEYYSR
jgi:small subunit ribosomal protein S4